MVKTSRTTAAEADQLFKTALRLAQTSDGDFPDLAAVLRQLHEIDPERFREFTVVSDVGSRKAYYLVALDKTFKSLSVSKADMIKLGWTKLMVLQPYISANNCQELIEFALAHTVAQTKSYLKGEGGADKVRALVFYFTPSDFGKVSNALIAFGAKRSGGALLYKEKAFVKLIKAALAA